MMIAPSNQWITCPSPNPQANLRLFCFPYAGGGALSFRAWPDHLPSTVEVCLIELPGRGMRRQESPFTQIESLVEALAQALLPALDKPFAFFGHSMGGLISFELARCLRTEYGLSPVHLFISARRAPQVPALVPPIHNLPEPAFLEEIRRLNGTPAAVLNNAELMQLLLPLLRADFTVLETYVHTPQPPFDCPITVFGGLQDLEVSRDLLKAWRNQTIAPFRLQMFPGDHFFVHSAQPILLQFLAQELQQVARGVSPSCQG